MARLYLWSFSLLLLIFFNEYFIYALQKLRWNVDECQTGKC